MPKYPSDALAKDRSTAYRKTPRGVCVRIYHHQEQSAKHRKMALPTYSREELEEWIFAQPNFKTLYDSWVSSGYSKNKSLSVDRIDDDLSYTFSNIQLTDWETNNNKGHLYYREGRAKVQVDQLTNKGDFIQTFPTVVLAAEHVGSSGGEITRVCKGIRKSCRGYKWRYTVGKI